MPADFRSVHTAHTLSPSTIRQLRATLCPGRRSQLGGCVGGRTVRQSRRSMERPPIARGRDTAASVGGGSAAGYGLHREGRQRGSFRSRTEDGGRRFDNARGDRSTAGAGDPDRSTGHRAATDTPGHRAFARARRRLGGGGHTGGLRQWTSGDGALGERCRAVADHPFPPSCRASRSRTNFDRSFSRKSRRGLTSACPESRQYRPRSA